MENENQQNQQASQPQYQQTVVIVGKQKSVGIAFLLAFLFGPLGLLYASVVGGIVMIIVGILIAIVTFGFGLIFVWIGCIIWAIIAANNANKNMANSAGININKNVGNPSIQKSPSAQTINLSQQYDDSGVHEKPEEKNSFVRKYFVNTNEGQQGPFEIDELESITLVPETLVWFDGLESWRRADEIPEITRFVKAAPKHAVKSPPPLPVSTIQSSDIETPFIHETPTVIEVSKEEEITEQQNLIQLPMPNSFSEPVKYCPKCGTQNSDDGRFCRNCGYAFPVQVIESDEESFSQEENAPRTYYAPVQQTSRPSSLKIFIWIAIIILILGAGGFAIWKFVIPKYFANQKSALEKVDLSSVPASNVNPALAKFVGDYYSDDVNIKRTRITVQGDQLLVETFFRDGIDSCYAKPDGNVAHCMEKGFDVTVISERCIRGYFSIQLCKR